MELCLSLAVVPILLIHGSTLHVAVRADARVPRPLYAAFEVLMSPLRGSHRTARLAPALVAVCEPRLDLDRSREVVDSSCEALRQSMSQNVQHSRVSSALIIAGHPALSFTC